MSSSSIAPKPDYVAAIGTPESNAKGEGIGAFDAAAPAPEFSPVPPGVYAARVLRGEFTATKAGAEAYRLRFEITEGEQQGKTLIRTWTFSAKAMAYTKRDLAPFGLTTQVKLLSHFPKLAANTVSASSSLSSAATTGSRGTTSSASTCKASTSHPPPGSCCPKQAKGERSDDVLSQRRRARAGRADIAPPALRPRRTAHRLRR